MDVSAFFEVQPDTAHRSAAFVPYVTAVERIGAELVAPEHCPTCKALIGGFAGSG